MATLFRRQLPAVVALLLLAGCSTPPPTACVLLDTDFEQFDAWGVPAPPFLTSDQAHSGRFSYRILPGAEYGGSYLTKLDKCATLPRKLRVSGWVYAPSGRIRTTSIVVQVVCHGRRPDVWEALDVSEKVKRYQVWVPVQKYIRLPADLDPSDEVKVYVWHPDLTGEAAFFDDIKLEGWQ
ncbi:hypothetical protein LRS06_09215 [Hymenobacter sp. J193]|uniref:hypothetical protein n=1 Tax=Hymenobacter sp. J193 TaxID=2898429 RepID=UPI00215139F9|nr:hypothetical protein [Hymenobacter sp. J193]MCR5887955.1 hypothetical protein [Hymenobacter sp. J193]